MKLATYVIGQGDTIEILARQLLGDATQADLLIQINNLRYPYISDNPGDQFARPKGNVYLTQSYTNPSSITINNPNGIVINPNDTVFLLEGSSYSSGVIQSVAGNTIQFQQALTGTFDQAAVVTVFVNQQNIMTQVLQTGNTIFYPANSNVSANAIVAAPYNLVLGTDWQLDENGYLKKVNGDIATITGPDNLKQALKMRYQTRKGGLLLHDKYGNGVFDILGEAGQSYFQGLVKYYLQECALQDIRVREVTVSDLTQLNDSLTATISAVPIGSQDPINQPITIPIGGTI